MVYRPETFIDENNETYLPISDVVYLGDEECHNKDVGQLLSQLIILKII